MGEFIIVIVGILILFSGVFLRKLYSLFSSSRSGKSIDINDKKLINRTRIILLVTGFLTASAGLLNISYPPAKGWLLISLSVILIPATLYLLFNWSNKIFTEKNRKLGIAFFIMILLTVVIAISVSTEYYTRENKITLNYNELHIEEAYSVGSLKIPLNTISRIELKDKEPDLFKRKSGVSVWNTRKGYFQLRNGLECFVNINSIATPSFIYLYCNDGNLFILNHKEKGKTRNLYRELINHPLLRPETNPREIISITL